ncbi:MAG: right-handed parallel beta-helix repeat-containing protein [Chitinophagales bacterium]|nr:right-handed parallel beta-helix repeat-containing protein [Chitinophagales bacterium]
MGKNMVFAQTNLYVDASVSISGNGSSWTTAYKTLKEAINVANTTYGGVTISVAKGTYYPTGQQSGTDRDATFLVTKEDIKILGGFASGGGYRDMKNNPTILSGDIGVSGLRTDNSYHIMTIAKYGGMEEGIIVDGFIFQDGQANGSGTLTMNGEAIGRNRAGALAIWTSFGSSGYNVSIRNCIFRANVASDAGGAVFTQNSTTSFFNCLFSGNLANYGGGALIYFTNNITPPVVFNFCTFSGNNATNTGGAIRFSGANMPIVKNSIIYGNSNGISNNNALNPMYSNSMIQGLTSTNNGNLNGNLPANNPNFINPISHTQAPAKGGDYHIPPVFSPVLNIANVNDIPTNVSTDLDGNARYMGCGPDMGCYEARFESYNIYVDSTNGNDGNTGTSWGSAYKTLSKALSTPASYNCNNYVFNIYVAKGTYYPTGQQNGTDRDATFLIDRGGIKIYGAYPPGGGVRNLKTNTTILSGNIGASGVSTDNSNHVMVIANILPAMDSIVIDGVSIQEGNATGQSTVNYNGYALNRNQGAGIFMGQVGIGNRMVVRNCTISGNKANNNGGGMMIKNSNPVFVNCIGSGNLSMTSGGFAALNTANPQFIQCTISGNRSTNNGAVYNLNNSNPVTLNSIIWNNSTLFENTNSSNTIRYSLVTGIDTFDGNHNMNTNPFFYNAIPFSSAPIIGGNFRLQPCSQALDAGSNANLPMNINQDILGNQRIVNSTVDMGAVERNGNYGITRYYVKQSATGFGSSWADATGDLQDAINQACEGAEIWVASGTYKPNRPANDLNTIDPNNHYNSFVLKSGVKIYGGFPATGNPTMNNRNWKNNVSILSGDLGAVGVDSDNAFHVVISAGYAGNPELDGFTITNGNVNSNTTYGVVGMTVNGGNVDNFSGGGIFIVNSSPIISNCKIINNKAENYGGGVFTDNGNPIFQNCQILSNICTDAYGGGMYFSSATPTIDNCLIKNNQAQLNGGGIYNFTSICKVNNSIISSNKTLFASGGGISSHYNSELRMINCLINNNSSPNFAGGIYGIDANINLINVTVANNMAGQYGEFYNYYPTSTIKNSIIWGNGVNTSGITANNSLIQDFNDNNNGNLPGNTDPLFSNATNQDYSLTACSPAVNAGSDDTTGFNLPLTDLSGLPRISGGRIDLGAYEFQNYYSPNASGILFVDGTNICAHGDGSSWSSALKKFDFAISIADSINSHTSNPSDSVKQIWVAKGTYQPSAGSYFVMIKNVKIYGGFAGNESDLSQRNLNAGNISILKGNGNSVIKNDNNGLSSTALLDGFTIQDGNSSKGGGVYNNNSSPSFANCIFKNNQATVQGGGMHNEFNASPIITNCTFQNNSAGTGGGGVFNYYNASPKISQSKFISNTSTNGGGLATNTNANPVITNCEFKWNVATGTGGAINNNSSNGVKIINCLIIRNKAIGNGGGVNNASSSSFIANCTFSLDSAANGGAIYNNNSNPNIKNCIISGNTSGMTNTNNSSPVITYSLVQGINGDMNNHILDGSIDPGFVNISNDDYTLFACSPLINQGTIDTSGLNLPATDLNQQPRIFENRIDMGAYETQSPHQLVSEVTSQPIQTDNCQNTNLSITANNATAFQWQMNVNNIFTNITDNAFYSGTTSPVLSIKDTTLAENTYRCIVIGDCQNDTSSTITYHHYPKIYFVKPNGSGNQSGSSWENASNDLQSVINSACPNSQIWVAEGVYYPTHPADNLNVVDINNRNNSFILKSDVKIFGGFPHTGNPGFNDRDQNLHPSILSGDIGTLNNQSDNVYHVLISAGDVGTAELNGFTVTQSNADGNASIVINNLSIDRGSGAGIHLVNSSPIIANCRFIQNQGKFGSGIFISNSQPNIQNCFFYGNHASVHGAGIFSFLSSNPSISNCVFFGNRADDKGAGMLSDNSTATIINCTFSGNQSIQGNGATIYNVASPTVITNCIIYGNSGGIYNESSTSSVSYSDIQEGYEGVENVDTDPSFLNAPAYSTAPFAVGDYRLQSCSPLINQGDNSAIPQETVTDISGNPRIQDGKVDIGAYENKGYSLQTIANTTLTANDNCQNADNWTHFSKKDDENKIFISINTLGQDLGQISASTTLNENYGKYAQTISMPYGQMKNFYPLNRSWTIQSQNTFLHPVGVRFYFNKTDSADVAALIPIDSMQQFIVYKVAGTDVWDSTAQNYTEYQYGAVADLTHYTFGTFQGLKYVEFQVSSFSTGTMAIKMDDATLPLDLLSFTASVSDDKVLLQWQTVNEVNVSHFEIESSPDAVVWNKIAHQNALNGIDQKYTVWDENPRHGVNYYRLKMIDLDGSFKYSKIVSVSLNAQSQIQYIIYPNPNKGLFYIQTIGLIDDYTKAFLYDSQGRILFEKRLQDNIEQLNIPTLVSGIYFLRIENNSNVTVKKIIVK